jgi:signal transduction histidine kinase
MTDRERDGDRRRIAAQLHDEPVQLLTVAMMRLDLLERAIGDTRTQEQLDEARRAVRDALERLRALIAELTP